MNDAKKLTNAQVSAILSGKKKEKKHFFEWDIYMLPIFLTVAVIPLLVCYIEYNLGHLSKYAWMSDGNTNDIFLMCKVYGIWIVGAAMLVLGLLKIADDDIVDKMKAGKKWLILVCAGTIIFFISTVASPFRETGFSIYGGYETHENIFVILCYALMLVYSYLIINDVNSIKILKAAFGFLTCVESILGITQITGHDFFFTPIGRIILIPLKKYAEVRSRISFLFAGDAAHSVYLTLNNPNYVGVYACMMLPLCGVLIFASRRILEKIWWTLMFAGVLISAFGSGSKTFIIGVAFSILLAMIFYRKVLKKALPIVLAVVAIGVVVGGMYFKKIGFNPVSTIKNSFSSAKLTPFLTDVKFDDDGVSMKYNGKTFKVSITDDMGMIAYNEDGSQMDVVIADNEYYVIQDDTLSSLHFIPNGDKGADGNIFYYMTMQLPTGYKLRFSKTENGYSYLTDAGKYDIPVTAPSAIFTDYPELFTGRGYIWGRTIPLLKKYAILGAGADGFMEAFPQNDYIGELNTYEGTNLNSKPHNMYLQIAINGGCVTLMIFLIVCAMYMIDTIKTYWKKNPIIELNSIGIALNLGVMGYIFSGLTNDSQVVTTPIFVVMLGSGFAVNNMVRNYRDR